MSKQLATELFKSVVITGLSCLTLLSFGSVQAFAMGGGMMGGGMMGRQNGNNDTSTAPVNPSKSKALISYVKEQHLACLQCHTVSSASIGPSFASIATSYAHQKGTKQVLSKHIEQGIGNMPSGLASKSQARLLAKMILDLYQSD